MAGEVAVIESALADIRSSFEAIADGIQGERSGEILQHLIAATFKELLPLARLVAGKNFDYQISQLGGPSCLPNPNALQMASA